MTFGSFPVNSFGKDSDLESTNQPQRASVRSLRRTVGCRPNGWFSIP